MSGVEGRYCVTFGEEHIYYDYDETVDGFEEELSGLPYSRPHFITMLYTSGELVRSVLRQNDFPEGVYIDNDFGVRLSREEFIEQGMPLDGFGEKE